MNRIAEDLRNTIIQLRKEGMSIPEIAAHTGAAKTTIQRYVQKVEIPEVHLKRLKEKQGGAKARAAGLRENVFAEAQQELGVLSDRDLLMLLTGLYWGEGTKRDFSVINSDVHLLRTFLWCLYRSGIEKNRIKLSLRVHKGINVDEAKEYWAQSLALKTGDITRVEVIEGKKKGKLPFGMCRIRVLAGIRDRIRIQSRISIIGNTALKKVVSP